MHESAVEGHKLKDDVTLGELFSLLDASGANSMTLAESSGDDAPVRLVVLSRGVAAVAVREAVVRMDDAAARPSPRSGRADIALPTRRGLVRVSRLIKHGGEYGQCWFRLADGKVVWVAASDDGYVDKGHTSFDDVKTSFAAIPGVKSVEVWNETRPGGEFIKVYP